jgi:hypothetical protein
MMNQAARLGLLSMIGYTAYGISGGGQTYDKKPMPSWKELEKLPHGQRTVKLWNEGADAIVRADRALRRLESLNSGESTILPEQTDIGRIVRADNPVGVPKFSLLGRTGVPLEEAIRMIALHGVAERKPAETKRAEPAADSEAASADK